MRWIKITDPNVAHEVETQIADATLKGKHEYVLSTHVDKDHVHCHLIFNATNFVDQNLVSSYGCSPETADLTFAMTAKLEKDNVKEKGNNLAWHMIISFKPGSKNYRTAHKST